MTIVPSSRTGWTRVCLLPFQAYVLGGFAAVKIHEQLVVHRRYAEPEFYFAILAGYWIAFAVLLAGGFGQRRLGDGKGSAFTWLFAGLCLAFGSMVPTPFAE